MINSLLCPDSRSRSHRRELRGYGVRRGVVLPMALILLVIISLVGVVAMRSSISSEQITKSLRSNTIAMQSAETALRYCETQALAGATLIINPVAVEGDPVLWRTRANWTNTAITNVLPANLVNNSNALAVPAPRCLIETYRLRRGDPDDTQKDPFQITAVGYTPDYQVNSSSGVVLSGGEVWLQSVLRLP